jgi:Common central domain of tyrosinase/Polyphenol oxidase middle domain
MRNGFTRRYFLGTAGAAASAALLADSLFNCGVAEAAVPLVRRDVGRMNASDPILLAYRRAIAAMQALPTSNPLSWTYQAAIHGTTLSGMQTAWNTCEHGTDFFWSWHRMYIYWFERIIRKMSGEPCWAVPYWDWAPGNELQLPAPFRDTASELYTANRNAAINSGSGSLNPGAVSISSAFSSTDFLTTNNIIQVPHGSVHVEIGGWMSSPPTAAQDPIFYLHHSNVDRQWNLRLAQGGGRSDPLTNSLWGTRQYTFFDENGSQVNMSACQILRAAEHLNYVYECEPPQVGEFCRFRLPIWEYVTELLARMPIPPVELKSEPVTFEITLKELRRRLESLAESPTETVLLELEDVESESQPGVVWEVYAGLPKGVHPESRSAQYIGSLSLFGAGIRNEGHKEFKPAHFVYPLNRALQAALKRNETNFPVTFVPVGILIDGKPSRPEVKSPVRIGKANLLVPDEKRIDQKTRGHAGVRAIAPVQARSLARNQT